MTATFRVRERAYRQASEHGLTEARVTVDWFIGQQPTGVSWNLELSDWVAVLDSVHAELLERDDCHGCGHGAHVGDNYCLLGCDCEVGRPVAPPPYEAHFVDRAMDIEADDRRDQEAEAASW